MWFSEGFWCTTLSFRNVRKNGNRQLEIVKHLSASSRFLESCLPQELFIAKLNAYRSGLKALWIWCIINSPRGIKKRENLAGSFNSTSLNIKFWKKYNLKAFLNDIVLNEANDFIFRCSGSKKIIWCLYFESISRRRWMVFYIEERH